MKADIEIAGEAKLEPIRRVAEKLCIEEDELDLYGKYKAKLTDDLWERIKDRPNGKLVLVTAINPTPAGEDDDDGRAWTGYGQNREKGGNCPARAIAWTVFWIEGRRGRRRICPGCADGRVKSAFYRGFPCHHLCQ